MQYAFILLTMRDERSKGKGKPKGKNASFVVRKVEEESKTGEKDIVANLNRVEYHNYLRALGSEPKNDEMANKIVNTSAEDVVHALQNGLIEIPKSAPPLPQKNHPSHRLSSEQARQEQSKAKREAISKKIQYLYGQIRGEVGQSGNLQVDFKQILTKQQHQRKVKQIQLEKEERRKRMQELQAEESRRHKMEQQRKEALRVIEQSKQKEQKRKRIQQKIRKRQNEHKQFIKMGEKLQSQYIQVQNKTRLYQEMEKKYQSQILLPSLEERKHKLKELRDFHSRYDVKTIREHESSYLNRSKQGKTGQNQNEWKYHPPQRSARLQKALRDQQAKWKEELVLHRHQLEEMQKRQELYKMELKEKHRPRVDQDKKKQIQIRLIHQKRKYEKTHPNIDLRRIGDSYLQMAKNMKRSQNIPFPHPEQQTQPQLKSQEQPPQVKVQHTQQFYEQSRRKRMDKILHSDESSPNEKYLMLKMESDTLAVKLQQKELMMKCNPKEEVQAQAGELLLSSIKAKMGIMSLMGKAKRRGSESDSST